MPPVRKAGKSKKRPPRGKKVALVCAGGGVTGAVYEIGCLRALDELLGRSVLDLDLYVGVSGGAVVASLTAAGISPGQMYDEATSRSGGAALGVAASPLYRVGVLEFLKRSVRAPKVLTEAITNALTAEGRNFSDVALSLFEMLPAGLLDSSGVQKFLHQLFRSRLRDDSFRKLSRRLLVVAVDIDTGETVAFGADGRTDVPVSKAVQASIALPGLYRPVRIDGRDYVDGGVRKTAHINLAIQNGADLVICINPIVPFHNKGGDAGPLRGHLSKRGVTWVLDQTLRIMLHGRMELGLQRYARENPEVDILVIEPTRDDMQMFSYNIMRYSARKIVAEHGYRTTLDFFARDAERYKTLFARHGIRMTDPALAPEVPPRHPHRSNLARTLDASLDRLDSRLRAQRGGD